MQYSDIIIDHAKNPHNFGELENATHVNKESNATCGDMVEFYLREEGGVIKEAKFRGVGCALSTAMASMLSEKIIGMKLKEIKELDMGVVKELMGEVNPGRIKCVMLPIEAAKKAVK